VELNSAFIWIIGLGTVCLLLGAGCWLMDQLAIKRFKDEQQQEDEWWH